MRIQGVTIPDQKRLEISLTTLHGVGRPRAHVILESVKVDFGTKAKDLTPEQENTIRTEIEKFKIEGDLKRDVAGNVKRLKDIQSYRGSRHAKRLPARGQRSKTNCRTVRGNTRNTMGSGRRSVDKK
ncbi:MAG: small subunit ribosomal protein S13 [Candidatus Paceibacteria bacterium]|jgi:small subunit ribosomal protein S13